MKSWLKLVLGYIIVGILAVPTVGAAIVIAPGSFLIQLSAILIWFVLAVYTWNKLGLDMPEDRHSALWRSYPKTHESKFYQNGKGGEQHER